MNAWKFCYNRNSRNRISRQNISLAAKFLCSQELCSSCQQCNVHRLIRIIKVLLFGCWPYWKRYSIVANLLDLKLSFPSSVLQWTWFGVDAVVLLLIIWTPLSSTSLTFTNKMFVYVAGFYQLEKTGFVYLIKYTCTLNFEKILFENSSPTTYVQLILN